MGEEAAPIHVKRQSRRARRSARQKFLSRYLQYVCLRAGHALLCRLPLPAGRALGWLAGTLAYWLVAHERRVTFHNLNRVYGAERSPREIRRLARAVFRHAAIVILEWIILRRWPREKLLRRFPEAAAALQKLERDAAASGSGVVGLTAHFGNWEVLNLFFSHFTPGFMVPIAKPAKFPRTQEFLHRLRSESGNSVYYTDESARKLIRAVRDGKLLGFLPDQELRTNSGIFVDFIGQPAYTVVMPVRLARDLDAKMTFCLLRREGRSFRVICDGLFDVPRTGDDDDDIRRGTELWSRLLEDEIRKCPEQWVWFYSRWRSPPDRPRRHFLRRKRRDVESEDASVPADSAEAQTP